MYRLVKEAAAPTGQPFGKPIIKSRSLQRFAVAI
jgi:hypothetical protein